MKFKNYYNDEVFDDGRIWSYKRKKFLKHQTRPNGYQQVCLSDNEGNRKWYYVHRVVWESVTGSQIPKGYEINHISENKTENMITNLQLVSHKENINYGSRTIRSAKAQRNNEKRSKQVCAYRNCELIMTFKSVNEARRQGFNKGNVAACCRGELKTYKGYSWRYI